MKLTKINIYPVNRPGVAALADIIIDGCFAVNELRITVSSGNGELHVQWPVSQHSYPSRVRYIACPITRDAQQELDAAILAEYQRRKNLRSP